MLLLSYENYQSHFVLSTVQKASLSLVFRKTSFSPGCCSIYLFFSFNIFIKIIKYEHSILLQIFICLEGHELDLTAVVLLKHVL